MMSHLTFRIAEVLLPAALTAVLIASPVAAQVPQSPPAQPRATAPEKQSGILEGSVKKVDPAAGVVRVSAGPLGMFGRTHGLQMALKAAIPVVVR